MATQAMSRRGRRQRGGEGGMKSLGRAVRYISRYRRTTSIAVIALLISIGAQLMVPQLNQNILDTIV